MRQPFQWNLSGGAEVRADGGGQRGDGLQLDQAGDLVFQDELVPHTLQIPCVIFALFLGPWSDRAGRKLLILVPYVGYFLFCIVMLVNTYFFDQLVVEFLWFENISALCGSYVIFLIGCYGFLADTTSPDTR